MTRGYLEDVQKQHAVLPSQLLHVIYNYTTKHNHTYIYIYINGLYTICIIVYFNICYIYNLYCIYIYTYVLLEKYSK